MLSGEINNRVLSSNYHGLWKLAEEVDAVYHPAAGSRQAQVLNGLQARQAHQVEDL
jgi:hypothetical protein